jgi:predicted Zn-dependent peptidase
VAGSLADIARFGLAEDYFITYPARVDALTEADVERAVSRVVQPGGLTWVIVGDRAKVEAPLESLGLKIIPITADGAPAG